MIIASWTNVDSIMFRYFPQTTATFMHPLLQGTQRIELTPTPFKQQMHKFSPVFFENRLWPEIK